MLLGNLVALSLNVLLALGSIAVSLRGLSGSLVVTSITSMADDLGVVTNNSGAVMNLLVGLCALCGECLLTLFNVGCVNNSLAHWSWNLSMVLLWDLVAHLLNMLLALGSRGVSLASISRLSISFSLSVSLSITMTMGDNLGVMTNNSGAMVDLLVCLLAVLGHNILALLNVGCVHNDIIFFMAFLSLVLDWLLVALLVWLAEALEVVVRLVAITWLSLSISLGISMSSMDNL